MSHLIIFAVDNMRFACHQIQLCMHERTHGIFDKSRWPVEVKYNDHCQSIGTYERGLSENTMDVIRGGFLKRAR